MYAECRTDPARGPPRRACLQSRRHAHCGAAGAMRVLHVYKTYYPDSVGGIEQVICQLARGLSSLGAESRIFVLSPSPEPEVLSRPEAQVHRCRTTVNISSNTMSVQALSHFRREVEWADVIHYQFPWPFGDVLHLLWGHRKPSIVTYQSDIVRQKRLMTLYRPLMMRFLESVDTVVATSPGYMESSAVLRSLHHAVDVVPNGVDEETYPPPSAEVLAKWRARVGEGFFFFVGVLRYYKGLQTLVQAAKGFDGQVVIAGDGTEGASLHQQVKDDGVTNVHLLGHISEEDKMALMALSRAFVFPSDVRSEAFGMSLVEAAMCGKPMISCEIGTGTSFINMGGETGWTVAPGDADQLRHAMQKLASDDAQAAEMGRAARRRYREMFTARHMAQAYLSIYRRMLDARK